MGKISKALTAIVLGSTLIAFSAGCKSKPQEEEYVTGIVLKESGTIVDRQKVIERSEGAWFGNDSVRLGDPTYAIQFKADDGKVYNFAVEETYQHRLEALNLAIEDGTKIRMSRKSFDWYLKGTVGQIKDTELEVLGK